MKTSTFQLVAGRPSTPTLVACHTVPVHTVPIRTVPIHTDPIHTDPINIVAANHPSLDRDVESFLEKLPFERPSRLLALSEHGGVRLAAIECGRVVGLARIDEDARLHLAVAFEHRGLGIGTRLGRAALERAIALEYSRVSLRTARRSRAARRVGESLGCIVVENASGRSDMIAHLPTRPRWA